MEFTTRDGKKLVGVLLNMYPAFEGGMRYILFANGVEYRCIKDGDGNLIEYVA